MSRLHEMHESLRPFNALAAANAQPLTQSTPRLRTPRPADMTEPRHSQSDNVPGNSYAAQHDQLFCQDTPSVYPLRSANVKLADAAGEVYQIDIVAGFRVMGVDFKILCECKLMNRALERDSVLAFAEKVKQLKAHKGIIFCNGGFQSGAVKYAQANGIALVKVVEDRFVYETKSAKINGEKPKPMWIELYGVIPDADGSSPEADRANWRTPEELGQLLGLPA